MSLNSLIAHVRAYTFCIYVLHIQLASIVENGEAVQVGCGATWLFKCARITKGQGSALKIEQLIF